MTKIIRFILTPWRKWKESRMLKRRLAQLRERDPFIYK
jgi:hypothetical protein